MAQKTSELHWNLDARIYLDGAVYAEDTQDMANGMDLRSARLAFEGDFDKLWAFELDLAVEENEMKVRDAWVARDWSSWRATVGNHKEPMSQEELMSSRLSFFMERALDNELAPGRALGLSAGSFSPRWSATAGVYGQEVDEYHEEGLGSEGYGVGARLTALPVQSETALIHIGLSGNYRTPDVEEDDADQKFRFRTRSETKIDRTRFLNTGKIKDVDNLRRLGAEFAAIMGPVLFQAEYMAADIKRINGEADAGFFGYHAQATYVLGTRQRAYADPRTNPGELGAVIPRPDKGAWEFGIRYSVLDLNDEDADVYGGKGENITLGVNWYVHQQVRIMANYVIANHDEHADADGDAAGDEDFKVLQVRLQIVF